MFPMSTQAASPVIASNQRHRIFAGLILAVILAVLDQSIVSTALPVIAGEFGGLDHLTWVVAFMLTSTVSVSLYGKLSDMYGRKPFFAISIMAFVLKREMANLPASFDTQALRNRGHAAIAQMNSSQQAQIVAALIAWPLARV